MRFNTDAIFFYNKEEGTIRYFSEKYGVPYSILYSRVIILKWSMADAIEKEVRIKTSSSGIDYFKCEDGVKRSIPEIAKFYDVNYATLNNRLKKIRKKNSGNLDFNAIIKEINKIKLTKENKIKNSLNNDIRKRLSFIDMSIDKNDPIYSLCVKDNRDYKIVSKRIKSEGFTYEEAIEIPLDFVNTKNLIYKNDIGDLRYLCRKYKKDYMKVYNMLIMSYTLDYAMELDENNILFNK